MVFLQETHGTQEDYNDLVEDWNIEIIISGNSTSSKGVAILLNDILI